ncbi:hypothetical protein RUM44_012631 [Polyplax serrata]|uniref:Odorant receptor n=1 Tax=Polyplax serrata TaxID=468196 RepID=A0ABR1BBV0_POLSC
MLNCSELFVKILQWVNFESELFKFPFSRQINVLFFLGVWALDSDNRWVTHAYGSYRLVTFLILVSCVMCQGIDFWMALGNLEKMTYNMCTSVVTLLTTIKLLIILQRSDSLRNMRKMLMRDYYGYSSPQDETIKRHALDEMNFISKTYLGALSVFLPICMLLGFFSYLWGPRELPFPSFFPINYDIPSQYNIAFLIEVYCGALIITSAILLDLVVFGVVLQIAAQYKILHKDILTLNEFYSKENEVNILLKRDETVQYLKKIISRQKNLMRYVKKFEWCFNESIFIHILGGSILIIVNGLQVLKMSYTVNHKLIYEIVYLVLLIVDMYYNCHYMNILTLQCKSVGDAAYSIDWYEMDAGLQKYLLMVIMQAQRPPRITAGKLFVVDLNTFLSVGRHSRGLCMLV